MKNKFVNGRFYAYKFRDIAAKLGWSVDKTFRTIKRLEYLGWIKKENNTIQCLRAAELFKTDSDKYATTLKVKPENNTAEAIEKALYYEILKNKYRQYFFMDSLIHDCTTPGKDQHKAVKLFNKRKLNSDLINTSESKNLEPRISISFIGLAKLFKVSISKAFSIIKSFEKTFDIKKEKNLRIIQQNATSNDVRYGSSRCINKGKKGLKISFVFQGTLYQQLPNYYTIPSICLTSNNSMKQQQQTGLKGLPIV